ncbi:MAG: hypothetical protein LVO36_02090, partial [Nitrosopumilus sp. (ex Thoosa mismalolli)]|nr:hypothetical protein [Nitrosopumilus sp. (ex Thoosa mismalolli)]
MMSFKLLAILLLAVAVFFPANSVYGHGLGLDKISSIDIQGKEISISVEMPSSFENGEDKIAITATEDETKENAKNVTFLIGLFHDNAMIFRNYFFAENGVLPLKISSQSGYDNFVINGEQDSLLGAYHGTESSPIEIAGPIFDEGGLYTFEIEVRTIDEPTNIIEDSGVHVADLSVASTSSYLEKDSEENDVEFRMKSYFDKISAFDYNSETKLVTFEMPFDWSESKMSHIPVVHEEVHFPKDFVEFLSPSYTGHANGIELFKASVTIDDYTEEDERIVHFVLLQDHLRFIKNEMKKSGEPLPDNIVFTLATNEEVSFPLTAYTKSEDFQVNLSWDPVEIIPGENANFVFTVRDGATGEPLRNSDYTFVILQRGQEIHRVSGEAQVGGEFEKFTFDQFQTGPTIIKFENIRNTGQETEFGIVIAPTSVSLNDAPNQNRDSSETILNEKNNPVDVQTEAEGGGCLIATAAYGTELAPQVQFLREIRDNTVMSTSSGMAFMTGFNPIYY